MFFDQLLFGAKSTNKFGGFLVVIENIFLRNIERHNRIFSSRSWYIFGLVLCIPESRLILWGNTNKINLGNILPEVRTENMMLDKIKYMANVIF